MRLSANRGEVLWKGHHVVHLNIEEYNRITALDVLYEAIDGGIADIEAGRVSDFREFAQQLREDMKNGRV